MADKKETKKSNDAQLVDEIASKMRGEKKVESVEVSIDGAKNHTIATEFGRIEFVDGKATVSSDVADFLKKNGFLK